MNGMQWGGFLLCLALILGIAGLAQLKWIPSGKVGWVLVFVVAAGAMGALWTTGLPPQLFAGGKAGFGISLTMLLGAIVPTAPDEQTFRRPFFLGIGLVMLAANVVRAAQNVL